MKNNLFRQQIINLAVGTALSLLWPNATVAATPTENLFSSAGFRTKVASNADQRKELKTLPKGKLSPVSQNGKIFYVYPDSTSRQLYVGNQQQYEAYQKLVAKTPNSARPIVTNAYIRGNQIKVREFYGMGPLDER